MSVIDSCLTDVALILASPPTIYAIIPCGVIQDYTLNDVDLRQTAFLPRTNLTYEQPNSSTILSVRFDQNVKYKECSLVFFGF